MFEIHVADTDVSGGNLAVTWCITKDSLDILAAMKAKDPWVVLCTAPTGDKYHVSREYRKIVPLKDLIGYIEFRTSGKNNIFAFVVRSKSNAERFLTRNYGEYDNTITCNGDEYREDQWGLNLNGWYCSCDPEYFLVANPVSVEVPAGVFAAEPSAWEKAWVNLLFRSKCVDQCQFRRRRIFAYTVQPILGMLNMVVRVCLTLLALLFGTRNFTFDYLLHPIENGLEESLNILGGGTYFIGRGPNQFLNYARLIFMPIVFAALVVLVALIGVWHAFGAVLTIIGYVLILLSLGAAMYLLQEWASKRLDEKEAWYLDQEEQNLIVCNGRKSTSLKDLPAKHRTLKLRFQDLKSKICRPFSA